MYYSINNTSSTVGHGPAAISLLEGSSEPAVNSVAPLSLTPGSRAAECHAPSRADAVLSSPLTARASAVRTAIGPSRESWGGWRWESVRVESSATLHPCCFERLNVFKRRLHRAWSPTRYAQFQGNEVRDMSGAANTQKRLESCCGRTWEEAQVQAALRPYTRCARGALSAKLAILTRSP